MVCLWCLFLVCCFEFVWFGLLAGFGFRCCDLLIGLICVVSYLIGVVFVGFCCIGFAWICCLVLLLAVLVSLVIWVWCCVLVCLCC